jgi:hypothetical protein
MNLNEVINLSNMELTARRGNPHFVDGVSGSKDWLTRINLVKECPDNDYIPRHENAGKVIDGSFHMHNNIKINPNSYYGFSMLRMLMENKGVHEPQEEKAFQEVLEHIEENSTMLELGSYWGFYSLWFNREKKGKTILVEPDIQNFNLGKQNFELNDLKGTFYNKSISSHNDEKTITVDKIFELENIDRLAICHSDIQGFEFEMLKGLKDNISKIDYFFISTHSNDLHYKCCNHLKENNFKILCSADMNESFSYDGLIVAKNNLILDGIHSIRISKRIH